MLTQIAHFSNPHIFFRRYVFNNANRIEAAAAKVQGQRAHAEAAAKEADKQIMDSKVSPTVYRYNVKFIKFDKTLGL